MRLWNRAYQWGSFAAMFFASTSANDDITAKLRKIAITLRLDIDQATPAVCRHCKLRGQR
jgi:hypothetical protein